VASPDNLGGLALSFAPDQCEIYDPDDPSIDPTDPPTDPSGEIRTNQIEFDDEAAKYLGESSAELEEGGPGYEALYLFQVDGEEIRVMEDISGTDGKTSEYFGLESDLTAERDLSGVKGDFTVFAPGSGGLSAGVECGDLTETQVDPLEDPIGPCSVDQPIPNIVTPDKVADVIQNPPEYDLPDIEQGQLPVDL
jgi:hypothetical protein